MILYILGLVALTLWASADPVVNGRETLVLVGVLGLVLWTFATTTPTPKEHQ